MISCNLQGGLGNQMFQIAATYALSKENNENFGFDFDRCYTPQQGKTSNHYRNNIFKNIPEVKNYNFKFFYTEPKFSYEKIPFIKDLLLTGSFQSVKYFESYKDDIKDIFVLNDVSDYTKKMSNEEYTSIHIRRGDYLSERNKNFHSVCDLSYYKNAMSFFPNSKFIVFSDDLIWTKNNIKGDNIIYSPFSDDLDEFSLMSFCKNNIISNSTFSWWAAYLNKNNDKVVISPKKWFGPEGPKDIQDIIPNTWINID